MNIAVVGTGKQPHCPLIYMQDLFEDVMKSTIECKRFIDNYIDKIVVHKDKVEIVHKVASSNFNTSESDNDSEALHVTIVITREELQKYPKQRRKLSPAIRLGGNFSVSYEIVLKNTHSK